MRDAAAGLCLAGGVSLAGGADIADTAMPSAASCCMAEQPPPLACPQDALLDLRLQAWNDEAASALLEQPVGVRSADQAGHPLWTVIFRQSPAFVASLIHCCCGGAALLPLSCLALSSMISQFRGCLGSAA